MRAPYTPSNELTDEQLLARYRRYLQEAERPQQVLDAQHRKANARRFSDDPVTGFGDL